jgi:hypothetical protein
MENLVSATYANELESLYDQFISTRRGKHIHFTGRGKANAGERVFNKEQLRQSIP